jgi:hypothetical protein
MLLTTYRVLISNDYIYTLFLALKRYPVLDLEHKYSWKPCGFFQEQYLLPNFRLYFRGMRNPSSLFGSSVFVCLDKVWGYETSISSTPLERSTVIAYELAVGIGFNIAGRLAAAPALCNHGMR